MLQHKPIRDYLSIMHNQAFPAAKPSFLKNPNSVQIPDGFHFFKISIFGNEAGMIWGGETDGSGGMAVGDGGQVLQLHVNVKPPDRRVVFTNQGGRQILKQ